MTPGMFDEVGRLAVFLTMVGGATIVFASFAGIYYILKWVWFLL
jgi:hypothetical protein